MATQFDLIIVGSGPGGYVAAARAAHLGLKTACVEKEASLGGVCLNIGCIPSKALLDSSEYYHMAKDGPLAEHGIKTGRVSLDLPTMMARKEAVVENLTGQVKQLLTRGKVEIFHGFGKLTAADEVTVTAKGKKSQTFKAKAILLATGSTPIEVPGMEFDGQQIVSSTEALAFEKVPKKLGVVGGGAIGLELGSVWNRLGSEVTVIEMLPQICVGLDSQVARTLERLLKKQGLDIRINSKVTRAKKTKTKVTVTVEGKKGAETLSFDKLLVAVGRRPLTDKLGLDTVGIETDTKTGQIVVNANFQTNVPSIYAIGDLIAGPMLAHKASAEAMAAVAAIAGKPAEVHYETNPAIVYTHPEVASVGMSKETAKERNIKIKTGTFPFGGVGRAQAAGTPDGFVKVMAHAQSGRVVGVHIVGPHASELIAECGLAMKMGATLKDITDTIHGHPTLAEGLQEAAHLAALAK